MKNKYASTQKQVFTFAILACLLALNCNQIWSASEEAEKVKTAKKAFTNPDALTRSAALAELKNAKEKETWQMLFGLATSKGIEVSVRQTAFEVLCTGQDTDGMLSQMAARAFEANRLSNPEEKQLKADMATAMKGLEFKFFAIDALVKYARGLSWPELPTENKNSNNSNNSNLSNSYEQRLKWAQDQQAHITSIVDVINAMAQTQFETSRKTASDILKWWTQNAASVRAKDQELSKQKKEEAKSSTPQP